MARRTSPFGELLSLRQAMDRLFEDSYVRSRGVPYDSVEALPLPLDIYSTPDAIVVEAALPGVRPEDVEITVLGTTLTISGSTRTERATQDAAFMYQELRHGTFSRTVALPSDLDTGQSEATFEHGMLRLSIPKAPAAKPRQIRINLTHEGTTSGAHDQGTDIGGSASWAGANAPDGAEADGHSAGDAAPAAPEVQAAQWQPAESGNDDWQGGGTTGEWNAPGSADTATGGTEDGPAAAQKDRELQASGTSGTRQSGEDQARG